MKVVLQHYIYPEDFDLESMINEAGYAHQVDADRVRDEMYYGNGTRELLIFLELDTETGIIEVKR
jgi:hypothetical protein